MAEKLDATTVLLMVVIQLRRPCIVRVWLAEPSELLLFSTPRTTSFSSWWSMSTTPLATAAS